MGNKSYLAVFAAVMGFVCFLNLLGIEKALMAIFAGTFALKEIASENKAGKGLAWTGIILGIVYIITVAVMLVLYGPKLAEVFSKFGK